MQHAGAPPPSSTRWDHEARVRWLWAGLSSWLLLAVTLLAGAPRSAAMVLAGGGLLLGLCFARLLRTGLGGFAVFFLALASWTALTAVPLPCSLVRSLAPYAGSIWAGALTPLGAPPLTVCSLSVAPAATVQSAMNLAVYALLAMTASVVARALGLRTVLLSVLAVGAFVASVTLVHALFGIEHLFGVESLPARTSVGPASMLVNPNNLAGYMNLGVFSALGLLGSRRPPAARPLLAVGGVLCLATVIWSASRGGVASLGFGLLAYGVLSAWRHWLSRSASRAASQAPYAFVVVLAGVGIAVLGASPSLERELFGDDVGKLDRMGELAASLHRVDWSGVGRGGFDSLSARLMRETRNYTHEYVENFALSWLLEWGPWVGGAALLGLAWLLLPTRLGVRGHPSAEGAWLGLLVLLLQNFADLGLELPALAGTFAVLAAALEGSRAARRGADAAGVTPPLRSPVPLTLLLALLAGTLAWTAATGPAVAALRTRTQAKSQQALAPAAPASVRRAAWQDVRLGLRSYPADPYFVLVGGWLTLAEGKDAMPWAAEALRRAPHSARAHILVAEELVRRGALDQALLHVARAAEADSTLTLTLAAWLTRLTTDPLRLERAAPGGVTGARFVLEILAELGPKADEKARRHLLQSAIARAPGDVRVQNAEGWALLADLNRGSAPCPLSANAARCPVRADARVRILALADALRDTPACDGLRLTAALLAHEGRGSEALASLESCPSCGAPASCAKDRVELSLEFGDEDQRRLALGAFRSGTCDSVARCADAESWLGGVFLRHSRPEEALLHAWRAAETDPSAPRYLEAARVARAAGRADRVEVALSRARRWGGRDPELEQWLAVRRSTELESLK